MTRICVELNKDEKAASSILLGNLGTWSAKSRMSKAINSLLEKLLFAIEEAG